MSTPIPLKEFCDQHGQPRAASIMGVSQGRVSQILTEKDKEVFIVPAGDTHTWYTIKHPKEHTAA